MFAVYNAALALQITVVDPRLVPSDDPSQKVSH